MQRAFDPFSFLVVCISGWMNQDQQHLIEYLIEENRVLRERRPARVGGEFLNWADFARFLSDPIFQNMNEIN
jgi:hypothetical protein